MKKRKYNEISGYGEDNDAAGAEQHSIMTEHRNNNESR